jgi:putative peptidoglycan lipid II flippase
MAPGANSVLYYSGRLMQLPLGVFGIAIATAAFPALSSLGARQQWPAFARAVRRSLEMVLFIGLPSGVGLMVLRKPIVELIFQRGAFTAAMTQRTASALLAYASAVWAYCALHVLTRAFYSLRAPGVPARVAGATVGVNLALNLALVWPLAEAGLAAATALCAGAQVALLAWLLGRRVRLEFGRLAAEASRVLAATAAMGLACRQALVWLPTEGGPAMKLLRVAVPVAAGGAAYALAAAMVGCAGLREIVGRLRGREEPTG